MLSIIEPVGKAEHAATLLNPDEHGMRWTDLPVSKLHSGDVSSVPYWSMDTASWFIQHLLECCLALGRLKGRWTTREVDLFIA